MVALPELKPRTAAAIEAAWEATRSVRHDGVLRASTIGQECGRRLWYAFRWTHLPESHDGRQLRLFETGNIEEDRIVEDLRRVPGVEVLAVDPDTEKQFEVVFLGGHFTGHTDGQVEGIPEAPKTAHLLECKSHNEKSFNALKKTGVLLSKPMHYAQMQTYMLGRGLSRALYVAVNKNDDEIWTERIEFDPVFAAELLARAERIVTAERAPPRLHEDPASKMAWGCAYCPAKGICHDADFAQRNCRTCLHATPVLDGEARWTCARHKRDLSLQDQAAGCAHHRFIPDLVPGDQVDADEDGETIGYVITRGDFAGDVWIDGFGAGGEPCSVSL